MQRRLIDMRVVIALAIPVSFALSSFAVEGGLGRPISGMQIVLFAPIVTYSTKLGKSYLDFNAGWIHDFDVSNRVEGDGFNLTASLKF